MPAVKRGMESVDRGRGATVITGIVLEGERFEGNDHELRAGNGFAC
jgi:hypothetical protein